jgi:hypothetical protein
MRAARVMAVLVAAAALGGCGTSQTQQVHAKVEQFARATVAKDYRTICRQVLAPALLARLAAGGIGCEQAMQIALGALQTPSLSVGRVTVSGRSASALTLSGAKGQQTAFTAIELVKTSAGWRISSLGSPVASSGQASK